MPTSRANAPKKAPAKRAPKKAAQAVKKVKTPKKASPKSASQAPANKWLHERLARVPANKTVALLVDHEEVKSKSLACLKHLHDSADFIADLDMNKSAWIYTNGAEMRRCLLIQ